jgi:hypothetical protein
MYHLLDVVLTAAHVAVILFNLTGWAWKRLRTLHLWFVLGTLASWVLLGLKFGLGYCFLTDWHWKVKRALGATDLPGSFIQYLLEAAGIRAAPDLTDSATLIAFVGVLCWTLYLNLRSGRKRQGPQKQTRR